MTYYNTGNGGFSTTNPNSNEGENTSSGSCSGGQCGCTNATRCSEHDKGPGANYGHPYAGYAIPRGGFTASMRGGDPWNPTEEDAKVERDAFGQTVLFITGEWAAVKVLQGGVWVVRLIKAKNIANGARYVNLASNSRTAHILAGDATGGGHAWWGSFKSFWNGITGAKSMFPASWGNSRIMNAISEVATSNQWVQQTGRAGASHTRAGELVRYKIEGIIDGVKIRVITTVEDIITAFPIK